MDQDGGCGYRCWRVGGVGEWKTTVEDEEGDRGEEVKKVSVTVSGEVGRLG